MIKEKKMVKKTLWIPPILAMLLLTPMISPVFISAAYLTQIESMDSFIVNKVVMDSVIDNETFREVIVSVTIGAFYGNARVKVPLSLLNQTESDTTTIQSTNSFEEELWDSVWFCLPPGPAEQYVKYPHPNHHTRYYPKLYNLPWVIPDENYPINETFHPQYKHIHFSPAMTDELGRNIVYAAAYGSFVIGGVIQIGAALVENYWVQIFLIILGILIEVLGWQVQQWVDEVVRAEMGDSFSWIKNIRKSGGGYLINWIQVDWEQSFGKWRDTWFHFALRYTVEPPISLWWGGPVGGVAGKFLQGEYPI
ncbi:MAG: hypothetical protein QXZ02_05465 [Candidatus Bathyarchaeia archaeon]